MIGCVSTTKHSQILARFVDGDDIPGVEEDHRLITVNDLTQLNPHRLLFGCVISLQGAHYAVGILTKITRHHNRGEDINST